MAEYLEFSTGNNSGYTFGARIKYTISGSTLNIQDVEFKSNSWAMDNPWYLDGKILIDGSTAYTCDSRPIVLNSTGTWKSSGISCSGSFNGSSVSVQFVGNSYSKFFGVYGQNEDFNFSVSNSAKSISTGSDSGDSGGDNGGDSGGGGSDGDSYYYLWICQGEGTKVTVNRTWTESSSQEEGSYFGELTNWDIEDEDEDGYWYGYKVWYKDCFTIDVEALDGYELDSYKDVASGYTFDYEVGNLHYEGDDIWGFLAYDDAWIYTSATAISTVRIYDGYDFNRYQCYIYNGDIRDWDLYAPYIYNGEDRNWDVYS